MSKKKSRSIRKLPESTNTINHPPPEPISRNYLTISSKFDSEKYCFGEQIIPSKKKYYSFYDDKNSQLSQTDEISSQNEQKCFSFDRAVVTSDDKSIDSIIFGLNNLGNSNKSSSSSLSWGEEYKNEETKKIQDELEKVDRILSGVEPIPANYDQDEYSEWMETFPNLRILGNCIDTPPKSSTSTLTGSEEIIAFDPDNGKIPFNCDNTTFSFHLDDSERIDRIKSNVKKAVVDRVYKNISARLLNDKNCHHQQTRTKKIKDAEPLSKFDSTINIDNYLKISPSIPYNYFKTSEPRFQTERRRSSKSLIHSQITSSKWMKDDSPTEFTSLPFLPENAIKRQSCSFVNKMPIKTSNQRSALYVNPRRSINTLILPPITNNFRSISATPQRRNRSNSSLALSLKIEEDLNKGKSRLEIANGLTGKNNSVKMTTLKKLSLLEN